MAPYQSREPQRFDRSLSELWPKWPNYLKDGYFDAAGDLRPEFVLREWVAPLVEAMAHAKDKRLTMSQVRRFFQHCRAIETRLRARTSKWEAEVAQVMKLDIAAADAFGKSQPKIPELFHAFIQANVSAVKTEKDFLEGFLPHFEALVGFGSQHLQERERN